MNLLGTGLSLAALAVSVVLAAYVLRRNPRALANQAFFALMIAFTVWDACEAVERAFPAGTPAATIFLWAQGTWVGISAVPAALMQLALVYPEPRPWFRRRYVPLLYLPLLGWGVLIFGTTYLIQGVAYGPLGPGAEVGTDYLPLAILYAVWFYLGVALFIADWWRVRGGRMGRVQGLVVLGLLLGSIPAGVTEIFWPFLNHLDTRLGLGSVYTLVWSVFLAVAVVRYRYLVIEAVTEPATPVRPRHPLSPGLNYLVLEPGRAAGLTAFRQIVSAAPGLCVTGLAPGRVARFGLERTPILWITNVSSLERTVPPQSLDFELVHTILKFQRENPGTAILLDDLDYLAALAGFPAVARFLTHVANQASASNGTLIVTADPAAFTPEQASLLGGCVDHVLDFPETAGELPPSLHDNVLLFVPPQEAAAALALVGVRDGLIVTTEHPVKARRRFDDPFEILWITTRPEADVRSASPAALDTEARRAVSGYLASHPGGTIVLVGLEQISLFADFRALLAFVKDAADLAAIHGGRIVATTSPSGFPPRELSMIARRLDVPGPPVLRTLLPGGLPTTAPGNRTPTRGPVS